MSGSTAPRGGGPREDALLLVSASSDTMSASLTPARVLPFDIPTVEPARDLAKTFLCVSRFAFYAL